MKEYYSNRFRWMFRYTSKNFWYCLGKTLCIVVGAPIYAVCFVAEMLLTFVNMLFCWIPALNVVVGLLCKALIFLFGSAFYICVLTDLKKFSEALPKDVAESEDVSTDDASENDEERQSQDASADDND